MNEDLLDYLACPSCGGAFHLLDAQMDNGKVYEGSLVCLCCESRYNIRGGVPILLESLDESSQKVSESFGYKWKENPEFVHTYERRFWDNVYPLDSTFFQGKTVLEACCGIGIPDYFIARAGGKRVIGFDLSDSVFIAEQNCREFPQADFVQADIFRLPFQRKFDVAVCLAALHHLESPREGFEKLLAALKPGGAVVLWVYAEEGNGFVMTVVDPVRRTITTKLPLPFLNIIAAGLALILWCVVHGFYLPVGRLRTYLPWVARLPLFEYFNYIHDWPLGQLREMIFDQLLSPITFYLSYEELLEWFTDERFETFHIGQFNGMSHRAYGILKR